MHFFALTRTPTQQGYRDDAVHENNSLWQENCAQENCAQENCAHGNCAQAPAFPAGPLGNPQLPRLVRIKPLLIGIDQRELVGSDFGFGNVSDLATASHCWRRFDIAIHTPPEQVCFGQRAA